MRAPFGLTGIAASGRDFQFLSKLAYELLFVSLATLDRRRDPTYVSFPRRSRSDTQVALGARMVVSWTSR